MDRTEVANDPETGIRAWIAVDEYGFDSDPRDNDNLCRLCLFHGGYQLANELDAEARTPTADELKDWGVEYIAPVYGIDHSGITVRMGSGNALTGNPFSAVDPGGWDSGQWGFIAITQDRWDDFMMGEEFSMEKAREIAQAEVAEYAAYLEGSVFFYVVEDADGNLLDSCHGFIETDWNAPYVTEEAKSSWEWHVQDTKKTRTADEQRGMMGDWGALARTVAANQAEQARMATA